MFRSRAALSHARFAALAICATAFAQVAATTQNAAMNSQAVRFVPGSVIQIVPPSAPLKVAEKAPISLVLHDKGLSSVIATQKHYLDSEHKIPDDDRVLGGDQTLPVLYRPDGSAYIEFVPLRLGEIELTLFGSFPDRAFDRISAFLQVVPSERRPAALIAASLGRPGRDTDTLRLNLDDPHEGGQHPEHRTYLFPEAYYYDLQVPIKVDRQYARFAVKQDESNPVIDFDEATGCMRPLRRGEAVVETSYGGQVKRTCVLVRVQRDINDRNECESLFAAIRPVVSDPLETTWTQNPYGMSTAGLVGDFEFLTDRLEVTPPDHPVEFAQPLEIPVTTTNGKVLYFTVAQSKTSFAYSSGQRIAPAAGGTMSIPLVPLLFDDDLVVVTAHFADQGVSTRYFRLSVKPSGKGLKSVQLHTIPMENGYLRVWATLNYEQLKDPVQLPDLKRMTYRIDRGSISDVLRIEPDGRIRRVGTGEAMIVATFCGVTGAISVNIP